MGVKRRFKAHCDEAKRLEQGYKKAKSYLHNAMNHYGFENFSIQVLQEFTNISPMALGKHERDYITTNNPHYNVSPGGELAYYGGSKKQALKEK